MDGWLLNWIELRRQIWWLISINNQFPTWCLDAYADWLILAYLVIMLRLFQKLGYRILWHDEMKALCYYLFVCSFLSMCMYWYIQYECSRVAILFAFLRCCYGLRSCLVSLWCRLACLLAWLVDGWIFTSRCGSTGIFYSVEEIHRTQVHFNHVLRQI